MKSGTTWLQMIIYQLISDGKMDFDHMDDLSPWFEMELDRISTFEDLESPRFFKTHLPYQLISKCWPVKYIYVMRNGMDVAVSQYHHLKNLVDPALTFETSFDDYFINCKHPMTNPEFGGWFGHVAGWLKNKKKQNVLYVKYEDLKQDLKGSIKKIADFCGIVVDESRYPRILENCSFSFMKKHENKFGQRGPDGQSFKNFIRKGKADTGILYLNKKQKEMYTKKYDEYLKGLNLDFYDPRVL
jgi:hypothetical protein